MSMNILRYVQYGILVGAGTIIAWLWIQNKGLIADKAKQATKIAEKQAEIEKQEILIGQYQAVKTADDLTITLLERQLSDQSFIEDQFANLNRNINRGLEASKDAIIDSIPEPALAPECRIPRSVPIETMCAVRRAAGLPTADLPCEVLSEGS